jgi:hypothetical protein
LPFMPAGAACGEHRLDEHLLTVAKHSSGVCTGGPLLGRHRHRPRSRERLNDAIVRDRREGVSDLRWQESGVRTRLLAGLAATGAGA